MREEKRTLRRNLRIRRCLLSFVGVMVGVVVIEAQTTDGPVLRVLIDRNPSAVTVSSVEGDSLRVVGNGWTESLGPGVHTLTFNGGHVKLGARMLDRQPFGLRSSGRSPTRYGKREYAGWLDFVPPRTPGATRWRVINRISMERYLLGVLAREMGASFPPAALAAQAIASRSYALYQYLNATAPPYHVTADTSTQVYGGLPSTSGRTFEQAVNQTRGQVLFFKGKLFEPFYHSTCGGATASGRAYFGAPDIRPLSPVPCGFCRDSPFWRWQKPFSARDIESALKPVCSRNRIPLGTIREIHPVSRGPGGHAAYIQIVHARGSFEIDAALFRQALGNDALRSTAFSCLAQRGGFLFSGRGWGHGVGMCQFGVKNLAEKGLDAVGILQHYYRGSQVFAIW